MLRLLAGGALMARGIPAFVLGAHAGSMALEIAGAVAGLLLVAGLWTPVVGVLAGVSEMGLALTQSATPLVAIMSAGISISLAMIGPGAWSLDALLYGRKQILPREP